MVSTTKPKICCTISWAALPPLTKNRTDVHKTKRVVGRHAHPTAMAPPAGRRHRRPMPGKAFSPRPGYNRPRHNRRGPRRKGQGRRGDPSRANVEQVVEAPASGHPIRTTNTECTRLGCTDRPTNANGTHVQHPEIDPPPPPPTTTTTTPTDSPTPPPPPHAPKYKRTS